MSITIFNYKNALLPTFAACHEVRQFFKGIFQLVFES